MAAHCWARRVPTWFVVSCLEQQDAYVYDNRNRLVRTIEPDPDGAGPQQSSGALVSALLTGVDNSNGSWQYSTDGGANWMAFGTPTAASARLLAADANTLVRFVPNANFSGSVTGLTFRAWDQTAGAVGGVANCRCLTPREQARVIELLVEQVSYDGDGGNISITFRPTGIKTLTGELAERKEEAA